MVLIKLHAYIYMFIKKGPQEKVETAGRSGLEDLKLEL
jgi:hypothetical protein